ncbi:MFS transporter [Desulfitobacterium dehalogenans]
MIEMTRKRRFTHKSQGFGGGGSRGIRMKKRDFTLFLLASALLGITQSIDTSFFNNFLNDSFRLTVSERTILEIPREFPGFAVVFVSTLLLFLGDVRVAVVANALAAFGMMGMGFLAADFNGMVLWLLIFSMGQHLYMPISNSIAMNLSDQANMGKRLGQINGANTFVFLLANLTFALIFKNIKVNYQMIFLIGAITFLLAGCLLILMVPNKPKKAKGYKLILKKEYTLFYVLNILYGARKQIFLTFAPWVLIKIFNQGVSTFATLGFIIAAASIFFKPFVGYLIDKLGERFVLAGEAIILIFVCLGYAFSKEFFEGIGRGELAIIFIFACYIMDQMLMASTMARATYLRRIAVAPEDVSPSLSMGTTLDHALAMFIPWLGGLLWAAWGYEYVFIAGAFIAALNLIAASRIKIPQSVTVMQSDS